MSISVNQSIPTSTGMGNSSITTLGASIPVTEGIQIAKRYPDRSDNLYFLFIPLAVLVTIMLLSVMVYLMSRRRHKIFSKYHYVPSFSFDSSDLDDDREDQETDHLLRSGKLRLEEPLRLDSPGIGSRPTGRYGGSTELFA